MKTSFFFVVADHLSVFLECNIFDERMKWPQGLHRLSAAMSIVWLYFRIEF